MRPVSRQQRRAKLVFVLLVLALSLSAIYSIHRGYVYFSGLARVEELYMGAGIVLQDLAKQNGGDYPAPMNEEHRLVPRLEPKAGLGYKIQDPLKKFISEFYYLGVSVRSDAELIKVLQEFDSHEQSEELNNAGLRIENAYSSERKLPDVIRYSKTPVLIERPSPGAQTLLVLFLDNHVERLAYPGAFPVSTAALQAMDAWERQQPIGELSPSNK